jgi:hypothetical protein
MVEFNDRRSALIPVSHKKGFRGLLDVVFSSAAGTYGGWISSDELSLEHARLLSALMIKSYPNLVWRLNPYDSTVHQLVLPRLIPDETHTIDLRIGFDAAFRRWRRGHSDAVRQARRFGVSIAQADTEEEWKEYFDVYLDTLRRWGSGASSVYGWKLFKTVLKIKSEHVKLWTARHSGRIISGILTFQAPRVVVAWHAGTLSDCFYLRPQHYLHYEILRDACDRGYCWYDLNPSGGHEGVKETKKHFGATPLPAPILSNTSTGMKLARKSATIIGGFRRT